MTHRFNGALTAAFVFKHTKGERSITKASIVPVRAGPHTQLNAKEGDQKMYLLIRYPVGIIVEAVVLATGKNRMRIAASGLPDTIELRRAGSQWFTTGHQPVEFDFILSNTNRGERVCSSELAEVARAAGSAIQ